VAVAAVAFASPIHGEFVEKKFREAKALLPELSGPYSSADEAPSVSVKALLIVNLTGGTSVAAVEYAKRVGVDKVVALGFPEHNSLASALSTKAVFEAEGGRAWVFQCPPVEDCSSAAQSAYAVAKAAAALTRPRVLLIGPRTKQAERFEAKFGGRVENMSLEDFIRVVEGSPPDPKIAAAFGVSDERIAKIYSALARASRGFDGVAINCFPFIMRYGATPCLPLSLLNAESGPAACEGDLQALAAMMISKALTGKSGWISNVVYAKPAEAYFAHCTVALDMAKGPKPVPHFETGRPYGLAASLAERVYTAISVGPGFDKMAVGLMEVEESGMLVEWACRTQALVKPAFDGRRILELAPANHHIFIPGDLREELKAVAHLLGIQYIGY
jgi:L-fucose isomerase-like protein